LCNSSLPLAQLRGLGEELETHEDNYPSASDQTVQSDQKFLGAFFKRNAIFLMGMVFPIVLSPITSTRSTENIQHPTTVNNGARAPNPRVCFDVGVTSYLYDKMLGSSRFHILVFGSDLQGPVREELKRFSQQHFGPHGVFQRFGGSELFNVILITKVLPHELNDLLLNDVDMAAYQTSAIVVFDDRAPDEDAHCWYGINHARGSVVVVRPDLVVGTSIWPGQLSSLAGYFGGFLIEQLNTYRTKLNGIESSSHVVSTTILAKDPKGLSVNVSSIGLTDGYPALAIQV
jgi:phenol 2-monooxygenase